MATAVRNSLFVVVAAVLILVGLGAWLGAQYRVLVEQGCGEFSRKQHLVECREDDKRALCEDCVGLGPQRSPSDGNVRFFTLQTVTTTGFGSSIFLSLESVQGQANVGMIFGASLWSIITALFNAIAKFLKS